MKEKRKFKIIGCGGIGGYLVEPLCRYLHYQKDLETEMTLIDGDDFEERNQTRQIFDEHGNKAKITAARLIKLFPKMHFRSKKEFITKNNVISLLRNDDIVFLCVDNHKTRKIVFERCQELDNVVIFSGGNEETDGNVNIFVRKDGKSVFRSPLEYEKKISDPQDKNPADLTPEERQGCSREASEKPQILFMNNAIASIMCDVYRLWELGKLKFNVVYKDINTCAQKASTR